MCAPAAVGARHSGETRVLFRDARSAAGTGSSKSRHVLCKTISHSPVLPAGYKTKIDNYTVDQHEIFNNKAFAISSSPIIHGLNCIRHMQHGEQLWELLLLQSWLLHFRKAVLSPNELSVLVLFVYLIL